MILMVLFLFQSTISLASFVTSFITLQNPKQPECTLPESGEYCLFPPTQTIIGENRIDIPDRLKKVDHSPTRKRLLNHSPTHTPSPAPSMPAQHRTFHRYRSPNTASKSGSSSGQNSPIDQANRNQHAEKARYRKMLCTAPICACCLYRRSTPLGKCHVWMMSSFCLNRGLRISMAHTEDSVELYASSTIATDLCMYSHRFGIHSRRIVSIPY